MKVTEWFRLQGGEVGGGYTTGKPRIFKEWKNIKAEGSKGKTARLVGEGATSVLVAEAAMLAG